MNWNMKVQYYLMGALSLVGLGFLVSTYKEWFLPSPFTSFILGMMSLALYIVHILQKQVNRTKEITLISLIFVYVNLCISAYIYEVWKYEAIFNKAEMMKVFLILFLVISIYLVFAYVRVKISYKKVKGNQKHNETWKISKKKQKTLEQSDEIYISLGAAYENPDK
jgi:carbon starvation protein CstA